MEFRNRCSYILSITGQTRTAQSSMPKLRVPLANIRQAIPMARMTIFLIFCMAVYSLSRRGLVVATSNGSGAVKVDVMMTSQLPRKVQSV